MADTMRRSATSSGPATPGPGLSGDTRSYLRQRQLAQRWSLSVRTLEAWRLHGKGPAWLKIGGRVLYPLVDVEAFEAASRRGG